MFSFVAYVIFFISFISLYLVLKILGYKNTFAFGVKNVTFTFLVWSLINSISVFSGFSVPISLISSIFGILLGVPGLLTLVFLKLFF